VKTLKVNKDWVKKQLEKDLLLADNNEKLYFLFLKEQGYDITKTVKGFLKDMSYRKIPYIDSMGRASRLVQEKYPHLRGKLYGKRKKKAEEVKEEIISYK
jgi:hypothetical protein